MSKKIKSGLRKYRDGIVVLFNDRVGNPEIGQVTGYGHNTYYKANGDIKKPLYNVYTFGTSMEDEIKEKDIIRVINIKELQDG